MPAQASARSVDGEEFPTPDRRRRHRDAAHAQHRWHAGGRTDRDARGARRRRAQAARAGVGQPAGPADRVRPRLVTVPAVLVATDRRPARRGLPARHVRPPRPWHVGAAAGRGSVRRRAAVGRRPQRGDRAVGAGPADAGRVVLRRVRRHRLPRRLRRDGDRRRRPGGRRGAAHPQLRAHRAGPARKRRRRLWARPAHEHRGHPPLPPRLHGAAAQRPRLEHGAVLEHGRPARGQRGAVRARRSTPTTSSPACPSRCS